MVFLSLSPNVKEKENSNSGKKSGHVLSTELVLLLPSCLLLLDSLSRSFLFLSLNPSSSLFFRRRFLGGSWSLTLLPSPPSSGFLPHPLLPLSPSFFFISLCFFFRFSGLLFLLPQSPFLSFLRHSSSSPFPPSSLHFPSFSFLFHHFGVCFCRAIFFSSFFPSFLLKKINLTRFRF